MPAHLLYVQDWPVTGQEKQQNELTAGDSCILYVVQSADGDVVDKEVRHGLNTKGLPEGTHFRERSGIWVWKVRDSVVPGSNTSAGLSLQ